MESKENGSKELLEEVANKELNLCLGTLLVNFSLNKENYDIEALLYQDVLKELSKELKEQGVNITYSIKLLLEQIAMTIVRIQRARIIESNSNLQVIDIGDKKMTSFSQQINFHSIHPITDYIQKLEKQLIYLLKQLGLLPEQVAEKERILIVKRLKKKLFEIEQKDNSYEVEAVAESREEI